ncbi:MAG: hypothetical protein OQJ80_01170 [Kangiella sp.]|nr:hypothetical protein [Kangiella sp.]
MKKLLFIVIGIFFLLGCPKTYEKSGLAIELAGDSYFVKGQKIDDIEAFLLDIPNPESIEIYLLAEANVSAASVLHVLDISKELGFKEISVSTPTIQ